MSMLPQPGRPESEEGESRAYPDSQPGYYPNIQRPGRRFTTKIRILAFAVVAGTVLAIVFSFVNSIFILMSNPVQDLFGDRFAGPPIFFPTFVRLFGAYAPYFIVAAAIAAAAEHMIRRASATAGQNNRALIDALRELADRNPPSGQSDRPELVDPMLKNLNLEIDPRNPRE